MKKKIRYIVVGILIYIIGITLGNYAYAESINYKAEYYDSISYDITITGLEGNEEEYSYSAIICQETDITNSAFLSPLGKSFPIEYNKDSNNWTGSTLSAFDGGKNYDTFERKGQYYAYIAKLKKGTTNYEIIDGPTKIANPELPSLGERIKIIASANSNSTEVYIQVNALNTMLHNGVQRKIDFYIGEVTDKTLLDKLSKKEKGAYEELLQYAKQEEKNLKQGSFNDTRTGLLDYNIVKDYPIENGKYYFLHSILNNENETYVDVEDIGIYNGQVLGQGQKGLANFKYETKSEQNQDQQKQETNQEIKNVTTNTKDSTNATKILPKAGLTTLGISIILIAIIFAFILYRKNQSYTDIK